jgi:glucose/arabinose dehydrogenase
MTFSLRVWVGVATVVLALLVVTLAETGGSASAAAVQGDANCSGAVDPGDALAILLDETGTATGEACVQSGGDTDCDGDSDGDDALAILNYRALGAQSSAASDGCTAIGEALLGSETPTPNGSSTATVTPTPTATPGSECPALPSAAVPAGAPSTPITGGYTLSLLPADAQIDKISNLVPVSDDPARAILITERGELFNVCLTSNMPRVQIGNFRDVVRDKAGRAESDEGMTGFAFDPLDPDVAYLVYSLPPDNGTSPTPEYLIGTATPGPKTVRSRISRVHLVDGEIDRSSEEVLLDVYQPFKWHNVDDVVFGPDGMLYIGSGDGGFDNNAGQTLDDLFGAILRIDVHSGDPYSIPADNPFNDGAGRNRDEVWAYGLRNPWRFSFDGEQMWIADVGENNFEEVNAGQAGANYGWPITEGHECYLPNYPTPTPGPPCNAIGLATPRAVYDHNDGGCAITGGHVYHGASMPELNGYYIYGDWCSGRIWGFDTDDNAAPPILLADTNIHIVSWAQTADGEMLAVNYGDIARPGLFPTPPVGASTGIYQLQRLSQ